MVWWMILLHSFIMFGVELRWNHPPCIFILYTKNIKLAWHPFKLKQLLWLIYYLWHMRYLSSEYLLFSYPCNLTITKNKKDHWKYGLNFNNMQSGGGGSGGVKCDYSKMNLLLIRKSHLVENNDNLVCVLGPYSTLSLSFPIQFVWKDQAKWIEILICFWITALFILTRRGRKKCL